MFYRDTVKLDTWGEHRAKVKVLSAGTAYLYAPYEKRENIKPQAITVTLPATLNIEYSTIGRLEWRGIGFLINTLPVPIMALGRVDHYELTAVREGLTE